MPTSMLFRSTVFALALGGAALSAQAAETVHVEVQGGRSYTEDHGANAAFVEAVFAPHRIGDSRFDWSPDLSLGWIDGRDVDRYRGKRYGLDDRIALFAAGARFHYGDQGDWYRPLFFSFQGAAIDGRTRALSSGYQFVSTLGWQGRHVSFQLRHISNGGLHKPNGGETMALVGIGFDL
ncbi:lipid A 3-O-deacylase [Frateuria sp. Soil773]|uniref:acyloxyacyl hydrolase n=1 Tax=Frateuria sp. Soil773 TaxID=1736407 RepID=UPI0006F35ECA|nr:acyloxyacyl hydrolase [Frateuria sp. Soil773]KRE97646.1 lipid A 3-O-deacylase [Frateuria sp. Soil773]